MHLIWDKWHRQLGRKGIESHRLSAVWSASSASSASLILTLFVLFQVFPTVIIAQNRNEPSRLIAQFQTEWNESRWLQPTGTIPGGYMRALDDQGYAMRMKVIQGLVASGSDAIEPLIDALRSNDEAVRILAAQALGFLGSEVPRKPLLNAATGDRNATVRLYAVDSLGQIGVAPDVFQGLLDTEKNRDVKMHLRYAIERDSTPMDEAVVKTLVDWDTDLINSAVVGKPAPDFQLNSVTGQPFRLSDFRGKSAVVLVFIYGDT